MTRIRLLASGLIAAATLLVAAPAALAAAPTSAGSAAPAPAPEACPRVIVHTAEIVRTVNGPAIQVTGLKPHADTVLHLVPEDVVYVQQPDYWNYFVVGCGGTGPVVKTPFTKLFRVPTSPVGRYGITVNGIPLDLPGAPGTA